MYLSSVYISSIHISRVIRMFVESVLVVMSACPGFGSGVWRLAMT
jgi:hypothetical protein